MHFKFLVSPSFWLIGKCNTMYRKYFHRNLCPEELGFMLSMNFLTTPLAWGLSGILQWGLSPWETASIRELPLQIKAPQTPNPLFPPCHILAFILQGLSTPSIGGARPFCSPFPSLKHESRIASKTFIQTVFSPGDSVKSGSPRMASSQLGMFSKCNLQVLWCKWANF